MRPSRAGPVSIALHHAPESRLAMDITYIPMARGFVYLAAVMEWSRGHHLRRGILPYPAEFP